MRKGERGGKRARGEEIRERQGRVKGERREKEAERGRKREK